MQVEELLMEKEDVTGELREHTEQYRDRLLEQLEQIKHLQGTVDTRDAELEAEKKAHLASDEHAQGLIEANNEEIGRLTSALEVRVPMASLAPPHSRRAAPY